MFIQKRVRKFLKRLWKKVKKTFKIEWFIKLIISYCAEQYCLSHINDIFSILSIMDIIMK